jgi:hypothetical protein
VATLPFYTFQVFADGVQVVIELFCVSLAGFPNFFYDKIFHASLREAPPGSIFLVVGNLPLQLLLGFLIS